MARPRRGTKEGDIATKRFLATMTNNHGDLSEYYKTIGAKGGKAGHTGGFYGNRELASQAGRKGGLSSRRGKSNVERSTDS